MLFLETCWVPGQGRAVLERLTVGERVMAGEEGCEVAAGDLAGWPPESVGCHLERVAVSTSDLRARVDRGDAGEEDAPERGLEGRWHDGGAELCRDGLGGCVGLLGGYAALLDWEGC